MNIQYYIKGKKSGHATIYLKFYKWKERFVFSTQQQVPPQYWNSKKGRAEPRSAELERLNKLLSDIEEDLTKFCLVRRGKDEIKSRLEMRSGGSTNVFTMAWESFLREQRARMTLRSYTKYNQTWSHLQEYSQLTGRKLSFADIRQDLAQGFMDYLRSRNYSPNTVGRYVKSLKTFMNWSRVRELHSEYAWEAISSSSVPVRITYLEDEEVERLRDAELTPGLARVRDRFIIGCYTGLRFSDIGRLTKRHFRSDEIAISTQKDQDEVWLPISPVVKEIMERHDYSFPSITNQKANQMLKEAAKRAGLDREIKTTEFENFKKVEVFKPVHEVISTHMARRTFITLSLSRGMKPETIMRITGHSSYAAMKPYLEVTDRDRVEQYRKAWG